MLQRVRKMLIPRLIFGLAVLLTAAGIKAEGQGLSAVRLRGAGLAPVEAEGADKSFDPAQACPEQGRGDGMLQPRGLSHAGIYALRQIATDLTGFGVSYAVICRSINYIDGLPQNDYQPNIEHKCFEAARFNFHDQGGPTPSISHHSTAVCSILFGEDPDATLHSTRRKASCGLRSTSTSDLQLGQFYYQGVVPQAQANVYEFWHFLINNVFYNLPPEADILVADFGWQFEDWWTRGIESLAEHDGLIIVASIGNGSNACDPPLYPGAAANVIGVGVVDSVHTGNVETDLAHFSLAYPEHSSFGPTADGRCKPDIVAPGNCLAASASDTEDYELTGNWSSYSTPVAAGAVGLLIQKARQTPSLSLAMSPRGGNCVLKAILMNSATKLPYWHKGQLQDDDDHVVPLDYIQGAGMLNALGAYNQLIAGRYEPGNVSMTGWDLNLLDKNGNSAKVYRFTVAKPADKLITATVAWNRHYRGVYPFEPMPEKDADLRLELWAVDPANSKNDYLLDYSDSSIDNVEHIYCRADAKYTNYEIVILFGDSDNDRQQQAGSSQRYGFAWNVSEGHGSDSIFWHDLNADGIVNELDLAVLLDNWVAGVKSPEDYLLGDINTDGRIDVNDLQVFIDHNNRQADWYTGKENKPG
jgi:hypothetical protein